MLMINNNQFIRDINQLIFYIINLQKNIHVQQINNNKPESNNQQLLAVSTNLNELEKKLNQYIENQKYNEIKINDKFLLIELLSKNFNKLNKLQIHHNILKIKLSFKKKFLIFVKNFLIMIGIIEILSNAIHILNISNQSIPGIVFNTICALNDYIGINNPTIIFLLLGTIFIGLTTYLLYKISQFQINLETQNNFNNHWINISENICDYNNNIKTKIFFKNSNEIIEKTSDFVLIEANSKQIKIFEYLNQSEKIIQIESITEINCEINAIHNHI